MHELRVHIFRRDRHFKKANKSSNPKEKKEFYLIAYKENLILQKYFTQSTKNSVYGWVDDKIKKIEALTEKNIYYESPVSANIFTAFSEKAMWITIFVLIFLLTMINLILPVEKKQSKTNNS
jgi:hypothetical protein